MPFFDSFGIALLRVLTDRGTEYCGNPEHHEYELYLAIENIDHTCTKARSPQTNGIVERLHKTMLNEFYYVTFRKRIYESINVLQTDLDAWLDQYNNEREHPGRWCYGKTPMRTHTPARLPFSTVAFHPGLSVTPIRVRLQLSTRIHDLAMFGFEIDSYCGHATKRSAPHLSRRTGCNSP